jgi:hypothetical protein
MKKKKQELKIGNQVRFQNSGNYDRALTHTISSSTGNVGRSGKSPNRLFSLRGSDGKERFAIEAELRLASSRERY